MLQTNIRRVLCFLYMKLYKTLTHGEWSFLSQCHNLKEVGRGLLGEVCQNIVNTCLQVSRMKKVKRDIRGSAERLTFFLTRLMNAIIIFT